jgi:calpain-7
MQAAELCLKALEIATDPAQRTEIRSNCQSLLDEAERIKLNEKWQPLVSVASERSRSSQHSTSCSFDSLFLTAFLKQPLLKDDSINHSTDNLISLPDFIPLNISDTPPLDAINSSRRYGEEPRETTSIRRLIEPTSKRKLAKSEQIILFRGSKLNGFQFPPWTKPPRTEVFDLVEGEELFL